MNHLSKRHLHVVFSWNDYLGPGNVWSYDQSLVFSWSQTYFGHCDHSDSLQRWSKENNQCEFTAPMTIISFTNHLEHHSCLKHVMLFIASTFCPIRRNWHRLCVHSQLQMCTNSISSLKGSRFYCGILEFGHPPINQISFNLYESKLI